LIIVVLVNHYLSKQNKDVAAVLVCAALGDTLKRFANLPGYDSSGINMIGVVNYLKTKDLMSGVQKSLFGIMPIIRKHDVYMQWVKITQEDIRA